MILESEVDSYGGNVELVELVIGEAFQEGRLANGCRSNQNYLHYIVIFSLHFILIILSPSQYLLPSSTSPFSLS